MGHGYHVTNWQLVPCNGCKSHVASAPPDRITYGFKRPRWRWTKQQTWGLQMTNESNSATASRFVYIWISTLLGHNICVVFFPRTLTTNICLCCWTQMKSSPLLTSTELHLSLKIINLTQDHLHLVHFLRENKKGLAIDYWEFTGLKNREIIVVPSRPSSHAPTDSSLPPCCLAWHQLPLTQMVKGDREIQRETGTQREWQQLIPSVNIESIPPVPLIHTFLSINHMYPYIYLPSIQPYLFFLQCLHSSLHASSIYLMLPPTAIHPFTSPIRQSIPQRRSYLVSGLFTRLLSSEIRPFTHPFVPLHPPVPSFVSSHQG